LHYTCRKAATGFTNDGANVRPLVDTVSSIGLALADAEFDSELNHTHIRQLAVRRPRSADDRLAEVTVALPPPLVCVPCCWALGCASCSKPVLALPILDN
jgi:hypothetical protein